MTFKDIICPVCGASCDDIRVDLTDNGLSSRTPARWAMPSSRRSSAITE